MDAELGPDEKQLRNLVVLFDRPDDIGRSQISSDGGPGTSPVYTFNEIGFEIARLVGLQQLYTEVVTTQGRAVKAFQDLGFQHKVTLDDYFVTSSGETLDMAVLALRLVDRAGEF